MSPRRMLLLLAGFLLFGGTYAAYSRALGWLDGLPQLPAALLTPADAGNFQPPVRTTSPTVERLREAFGPDCPEQHPAFYPNQLEFRSTTGESSIVLAAGQAPFTPGSKRVVLAPFSLAVFGKPRPPHLRLPDEVTEISTFHADKAVLEFDRAINGPNDMSKAKLLKLELVSEPEQALPDPRRGTVHITTNQRSADPNKFLVLRTPGPVFYRDAKNNPGTGNAPDIWTDAAVEITDRQNLPRAYGAPSPRTTAARGEDLRDPAAVPEILAGLRLPPPTVTAVGMRIFLEPDGKTKPAPTKGGAAGFSGVQRVELSEKVLINLWVDSRQGFVSTPVAAPVEKDKPKDAAPPAKKPAAANPFAVQEPPPATAAVAGAVLFGTQTVRQLDRALVQIETLGPFAYDAVKNVARFDVVPQANPALPNDVQVTRIPPRGGQNKLFSQVLELEFDGPPTGPQPATPADKPKPAETAGPSFKRLHAWTYTPGRYLTVAADADKLEAYGQDLVYVQAENRTVLQGAPVVTVRERHVLTAGSAQQPAKLVIEPGPDAKTTLTVHGPGKIELFDPASNRNTIHASWQTSLTHRKVAVNDREMDMLVFAGGGRFEQLAPDDRPGAAQAPEFWLQGQELTLWIEAPRGDPNKPVGMDDAPTRAVPHRVQAVGNVTAHSSDFDIEQAEHLNVMFREGEMRVGVATRPGAPANRVVTAPGQPGQPMPMGNPNPMPAAPEPAKPKPPMKLRARTIDTWVARNTVRNPGALIDPAVDVKPNLDAAPEVAVKYELERARCDGRVVVHQDPADPTKPRGTDILGDALLIDHSPRGSVMTVTGTDAKPGEVHHENTSIIGPKVVIDQLHNLATVEGRGAMAMPAGSGLSGGAIQQPEMIVVHWRDGMTFSGAKKTAEFVGKVAARQGESWVVCHTLQVILDRPVDFTRVGRPAEEGVAKDKEKDQPKVEAVYCYPAPEDAADEPRDAHTVTFNEVIKDEAGRVVKTQQLTARELVVTATGDDARGDRSQKMVAHGPGTLRIWQPGSKDQTDPGQPPNPRTGGTAPKPAETEMKLTVVTYAGRMTAVDKGKLYQQATFQDNIQVIHVPTDDRDAVVARHKLPPRAVVLTCADKLVVSTHRPANPAAPPVQRMDATGNGYVRSDEYDGYGETIVYDGQTMTLEGTRTVPARIASRFKGTNEAAERIIYDRATNSYKTVNSAGGTIQTPGKK